jgi:hypothetical protein
VSEADPEVLADRRVGCGSIAFAAIGAGFAVSGAITFAMGDLKLYPYVAIVTLLIVLSIGGVAAALIRERPTWRNVLIGGFITGALLPTLLLLVSAPDSASVGGVATVVDGSYTWAGWRQNITLVVGFGLAGMIGASLVWLLVHGLQMTRWFAGAVILGLIGIGVASIWLIPEATADRSCHNPLRDSRTSISPVAGFTLIVPMSEWRALQQELDRFAKANGWQVRADVRPEPSFPWFQISLCREAGTNIFVSRDFPDKSMMQISVFQPQGGDSWQEPLRSLQDALRVRWQISDPNHDENADSMARG